MTEAVSTASPTPVRRRDLTVRTDDGVDLPATLFVGENADTDAPAILLSSAAAVERRFYRAFAEYLLERGAQAVLTYNYRGLGAAARQPGARQHRMKEWGTRDFPAALEALQHQTGATRLVGIGHSFGGLAIGLSGVSAKFERYAMVASLNGYYRRTREPLKVFARMNFAGVPATYLLGQVPASLGLGTALAGPIFRDWARWCRREAFFFDDPAVAETSRFADVRLPLLSIGIADDPWGTPAAVSALLRRFPNADLTERWLSAPEGQRAIGHSGFFKRNLRSTLWQPVADFLLAGTVPPAH
ncbi:alpha/beta fold hydrolase [Aurantimonas aggregata]|uniref:Alpha/beta fold hydrolase n=1 Tax=Aurantimonas aggregata TaxID=2047720 RepID=A0A6L9MBU7_9HYPH|nr:alpha/beta fold hydrolase [Aurantimonas aggregata]NDV85227.1 alpha/beta fold hydrolase [Aurantimonas aggregata]